MAKTSRATAAVLCAFGAALGVVGMSSPASASGQGTADYSCTYAVPGGGTATIAAHTVWQHGVSTNLTIKSDIKAPVALAVGDLSTVVNGVTLANLYNVAAGDPVNLGPAPVPGSVIATNPLILHYAVIGLDVPCALTGSSGFPI